MRLVSTGGRARGLTLWLVALPACSAQPAGDPLTEPSTDDGDPVDSEGPSTVALDDFRSAFIRASCDLLFDCRAGSSDAEDVRLLLGSKERCLQVLMQFEGPTLDTLVQGARDGILTFDASEAARCIRELPRQCLLVEAEEPIDTFRTVCAGVFDGGREPGAPCAHGFECAGDATCHHDVDSVCGGVCRLNLLPGEPCGDSDQGRCSVAGGIGGLCDPAEQRCILVESTGALAAAGEMCGLLPASDHRTQQVLCEPGLWCDVDWNRRVGTCRVPLAEGDACMENHLCAGGLCDGRDETPGICRSVSVAREEGIPCDESAYALCDPGALLICGESGKCELLPASLGASCDRQRPCTGELYCAEDGRCVAQKEAGEPCTASRECRDGACGPSEPGVASTCRAFLCDARSP
jgi:hypothetical protein